MSQTAALLGLAVPFEYGGKTYKVAPRDLETEGLFSLALEQRALAVIQRHARALGAAAAEQRSAWVGDCAAGRYDFPSPDALAFMFSRDGMQELAFLQLVRLNPRVTRELVARIYDEPAPEPAPSGHPAQGQPAESEQPLQQPEPPPAAPPPWQTLWQAMERSTANFRQARRGRPAA